MRCFSILAGILGCTLFVALGCSNPSPSASANDPVNDPAATPGTAAPSTAKSPGLKNTAAASKAGARKLTPEAALFNRVIAYQVEKLLEDEDRKNCRVIDEYDADVKKAQQEFSAAYDRLYDEIAKGSQSNGPAAAGFAPARQALSDYREAEKKLNELSERSSKKDKEFRAVREAWFESISLTAQANYEFSDLVEGSLNAKKSSVRLDDAKRALEYKFVQDTKAENAENKELQAAVAEYEKIVALVESTTADLKKASAEAAGYNEFYQRREKHREAARNLLAKPVDASTEKAYEELRKEGQELAALESTLKPAVQDAGRLGNELAELEKSYYNAFKNVALLIPIEDEEKK